MTSPIQQKGDVAAPTTRAELDALVAQRSELQGQLRNAEERRTQLSVQSQMTPADQRGAITGRMTALDARIQNLESRIDALDEAISKGMANPAVVGGEGAPAITMPMPAVPPVIETPGPFTLVPPDNYVRVHPEVIVTSVAVSLSLMALVAWVTWRRALARFGRHGGAVTPGADVTRLQQSVDAIAIEVERISEGQRFLTKVLHERAAVPELAPGQEAQRAASRREL